MKGRERKKGRRGEEIDRRREESKRSRRRNMRENKKAGKGQEEQV